MPRLTAPIAISLLALAATPALGAGNPAAGKEKSQTCAACHGPDGNGSNTQYPRLAGQHESYLYHTLKTYKSGERENAVMSGMVSGLSDQDMRDLAAYYASQKGLTTIDLKRGAAAE
jgi:cytochrome c553